VLGRKVTTRVGAVVATTRVGAVVAAMTPRVGAAVAAIRACASLSAPHHCECGRSLQTPVTADNLAAGSACARWWAPPEAGVKRASALAGSAGGGQGMEGVA